MRRTTSITATVAVALALLLTVSGTALALSGGPEIQVNTTTAGSQYVPAIAPAPDGGFTVAWQSEVGDGDGSGVYARRFDSAGTPLSAEIPVNTYTTGHQSTASIAAASDGSFTVAWESAGQDGGGSGVYARRFNAGGGPLSGEILVNTTTTDDQRRPAIAPGPNGGFTVAWQSFGQDGALSGIYAQRFDAAGNKLGGEIPVNVITPGSQEYAAIASDSSGGFTVAWQGPDTDSSGIFARRFDSAGAPLSGEIPVNSTTADFQGTPAIAADLAGGFTVAWESYEQDGDEFGVYARRFDAAGAPLTGEIPVNTTTVDEQEYPAITADSGGGFTVAWQSPDGSSSGIFARRFDSAGTPLSAEIPVNTTTTTTQEAPTIATDHAGGFTAAWASYSQDGDDGGVYARRFVEPAPPPPVVAAAPQPRIVIKSRKLKLDRKGRTKVRLACLPASAVRGCTGMLKLGTRKKLPAKPGARKKRRITLAKRRFSIRAGGVRSVILRLKPRQARLVRTVPASRRVWVRAAIRGSKQRKAALIKVQHRAVKRR